MSDVWMLLPLLGIAFVLIMMYNLFVVHWADANEPWNRYELVVRTRNGALLHCSGNPKHGLFNNYARAKDMQSRLDQVRLNYWHMSGHWPVYDAWEYAVLDHKTMELV